MRNKNQVRWYPPLTTKSLPELEDDYVKDITDPEMAKVIYPKRGYKVQHMDGNTTYVIEEGVIFPTVSDGILIFEASIYKNRGSEDEERSIKKYYFPLDNVRFWTELV